MSGRSFNLSRTFPSWDLAVNLLTFYELLKDERVVEAMVHVGFCEERACRDVRVGLEEFLSLNPNYPFEILRALVACRDRLRGSSPGV